MLERISKCYTPIFDIKMDNMENSAQEVDICRICNLEGMPEKPLFHPCKCTGSIKYVHENCLIQWMHYSHNEYCEVCGHQMSFTHIYAPDQKSIIKDIAADIFFNIINHIIHWFYLTVGLTLLLILFLSVSRVEFNDPALRFLIDAVSKMCIICI